MPNVAHLIRQEIVRLSRREARAEVDPLRKVVTQQRSAIAALKRQVTALERAVRVAVKGARTVAAPADEQAEVRHRFSAKGLASHRSRVGLSAEQYGKLLGVTGQSIYKWEAGSARPRARQLPALAELKRLGRRALIERLG